MSHWFTADPHFGHDNIISACGRPFRDAKHMTAVLVERFWERVGPDDDLWVLGDFAFGPRAKDEGWLAMLFAQLPGARHHLVVGNHDGPLTQALPWDSVTHLAEMRDDASDLPATLCHYPMLTWNHARRGAVHLFGHVHGRWEGSRNAVNVGVDVWDFRPVRLHEAVARGRKLPVSAHWRNVELDDAGPPNIILRV